MRYLLLISIFLLSEFNSLFANEFVALSNEISANYYIEAEIDTSSKMLFGYEEIEFRNPITRSLNKLVLHLYPEAFRDTSTTLARDIESIRSQIPANQGYIDCDSIQVDGQLPDSIVFDETLLYVYLDKPLDPGKTLTLSLNFEIKIPQIMLRYGYDSNDNYLLSHWHPILAGYQKDKLIEFQYGGDGEFFSNFANYDVSLQIPDGFKLQSTANNNQPDSVVAGKSFYNLIAEGVIDFALVCGPSWQIEFYNHNGVLVNLLYLDSNEDNLDILKSVINGSLDYFCEKYYAYPYPNLSYIDFNPGASGMELPRMVVMSFKSLLGDDNMLKLTAVHEMAHQWFYSTIATNEYDEPWLDEGITSYVTNRCLKSLYGKALEFEFYGFELDAEMVQSLVSRLNGFLDPLASSSDDFKPGTYYINAYGRAPAVLSTLEGVLSTEKFDTAMKEFVSAYKFKHPDTYDFKEQLEFSSGVNLDRFFDQYVFGTSRVDYEINSIKSINEDSVFKTSVEIQRGFDGILPQEIIVGFKDGTAQSLRWDGVEKYKIVEFNSESRAVYAAIDTSFYYQIDENYSNNSLKTEAASSYSFAFSSLLLTLIQLMLIVVGLV